LFSPHFQTSHILKTIEVYHQESIQHIVNDLEQDLAIGYSISIPEIFISDRTSNISWDHRIYQIIESLSIYHNSTQGLSSQGRKSENKIKHRITHYKA